MVGKILWSSGCSSPLGAQGILLSRRLMNNVSRTTFSGSEFTLDPSVPLRLLVKVNRGELRFCPTMALCSRP